MYNRYVPCGNGHRRIPTGEPERPAQAQPSPDPSPARECGGADGLGSLPDLLRSFLPGMPDTGDLLLLMILLLVFLEGEDRELVVILALTLLLGSGQA